MSSLRILVLHESSSANPILDQVRPLVPQAEFRSLVPSAAALEELRDERFNLIFVEWSGRSETMREFIRELEKIRSFVPRIAFLTEDSPHTALDPTLMRMDGVLKAPCNEEVLRFLVDRLAMPPNERWTRKFPRVEVEIPIELMNATKTIQMSAMVRNVSRGGMFIELTSMVAQLERDQEVFFLGESPSFANLRGSGLIRWLQNDQQTGIGIQFVDMDLTTRQRIDEMLPAMEP